MVTYRELQGEELPADLDGLVRGSEAEGLRFLKRLRDEWESGANCFRGHGEVLMLAYHRTTLVGVCGLNRDPFTSEPGVARLRHLYVARTHRRDGVGTALVERCLERARHDFHRIRLRAASAAAGRFFLAIGFVGSRETHATHTLGLDRGTR